MFIEWYSMKYVIKFSPINYCEIHNMILMKLFKIERTFFGKIQCLQCKHNEFFLIKKC